MIHFNVQTIHGNPNSRVSSLVWCRSGSNSTPSGRLFSSSIDGSVSEWDLFDLQQKVDTMFERIIYRFFPRVKIRGSKFFLKLGYPMNCDKHRIHQLVFLFLDLLLLFLKNIFCHISTYD